MTQGPSLTAELTAAQADLDEHRLCLIAEGLPGDELCQVRDRTYQLADAEPAAGRGYRLDHDLTNQRVWALLDKGEEFVALVTDKVRVGRK